MTLPSVIEALVSGPWKPGLPPGKFYPEMVNDYEVYFSPGGMKWHRRIARARLHLSEAKE